MSNPREGTIALIDKVWREKYRYTGPDGVSHEHTIEDSFARVVDGVYKHDPGHKTTALALMNGRIWSPAGRIHAGSGTPKNVTMINCFVMRTIPDSLDGIMEALTESALTSQQGGGIGLDFSTIRPRGAIVKRTESVSSGVIPFMRMWNAMCGTIMSSGSRRGAMMAVLRCDHPDIIEFVTAKHTAGELTNFNISVAVTDAFMQAVMDDNLWDLGFTVPPADPNMCVDTVAFPNNQTWYVYKRLPARELLDLILKSTYEYSEPGVIFIDRVNKNNNLQYCETISATNPCVTGDTYIANIGGWKRADTYKTGNTLRTASDSIEQVDCIEINPDCDIYKVTFTDGGEITVTAQHQFYAKKNDAESQWTPMCLHDLDTGDIVRTAPTSLNPVRMAFNRYKLGLRKYGLHLGYALFNQSICKDRVQLLTETIQEVTTQCIAEDWKIDLYEPRIPITLLKAPRLLTYGILDFLFSFCGTLEYLGSKTRIKTLMTRELYQDIRLLCLACRMNPTFDGTYLFIQGEDLLRVSKQIRTNKHLKAEVLEILRVYDLAPTTWKTRIAKIEKVGTADLTYDLHVPSDTWITNGYVSRGCVPFETLLLTREGYRQIGDCVGLETDVWNGREFSTVVPFSTGVQRLYKVTFDNGVEFVCDARHRFPLAGGVAKYTRELKKGDALEKTLMPAIVKGEEYRTDGYSQGFYAGDGSVNQTKSFLYPPKYMCASRLQGTVGRKLKNRDAKIWYHGTMLPKTFVPIHGSLQYCLDWFAGLSDADGVVTQKKNCQLLYVTSIDKTFLQNIRLMLTRLGVQATVKLTRPGCVKDIPGGSYVCQDEYRLIVNASDLQVLLALGFKTERLPLHLHTQNPTRNNSRYIRVVSVEDTGRVEETFCVTEPLINRVTLGGITTWNCGEQPLPPYGQCCLGHINLAALVTNPFSAFADLDWSLLQTAVHEGVRFLDNVLEETRYPLPQQEQEAKSKRRIGLGITGLGNMLQMLGVRYGSEKSLQVIDTVMHFIKTNAYHASAILAKERGAFPVFSKEEFFKSPNVQTLPKHIQELIMEFGIRNGVLLTVAPTGTTAIYYGNVSSGLEPTFAWEYTRKLLTAQGTFEEFTVRDYGFQKYCETFGEPSKDPNGKYLLPDYMVTALELSVQEHVDVQAIVQRHVDASISKTVNIPQDMPFEDFKTVYLNAYNLGLKGCTTYRPSDIRGWVLSTTPTPKEETPAMPLNAPMERPEALRGMTYKLTYPNMPHSFYVCINDVEENGKLIPFEIFVNSKDIHTQEWLLPLTRMISAVFRRGRGDVAFVAEELQQVFSIKTGTFYNGEYCPSLVAALGKIIEKHFISIGLLNVQPTESKTGVQISDDNTTMVHAAMQNLHEACPVCKKLSYRRFDGCYACSECGYSKCD